TADVCQKLARRVFFAAEFDCEVSRFTSHCVCGVKGPGGIDKKSSAANLAVFVDAMNFDHRFGGAREDVFDLMANRCCRLRPGHGALKRVPNPIAAFLGGLLLRKERTAAKEKNQRECGFTGHNEAQILSLRYWDAQAARGALRYTVPKI